MKEDLSDDFRPFFLFAGGHFQTIFGSLLSFEFPIRSDTDFIYLPDNDVMAVETVAPKSWINTDPTVIFIHGLCGSHKSNYLIRATKKFKKRGYQVIRVNLRGCGSGKGLAKNAYHGGSSEDVLHVLKSLKKKYPESPFSLIGFSLGGNIALKLVGELEDKAKELIKHVVAISPPADLHESIKRLRYPENQFYERYFIKLLREEIYYRHKKFNLPQINFPEDMSLIEFDEYYLAPKIGYQCALEYYTECSSKKHIHKIKVPCQILFAEDDPIIKADVFDNEKLPENVVVKKTCHGGHLGYLSSPFSKTGPRWLDQLLMKWVESNNGKPSKN